MSAELLGDHPDDLTILTDVNGRKAYKTHTAQPDGSITTVEFDNMFLFRARIARCSTWSDRLELAEILLARPHSIIVRGAVRPNADPNRMRRLLHDTTDEKTGEVAERTLEDAARAWADLDIDTTPSRREDWFDGLHFADEVRTFIETRLPSEFAGCAFIATATANAGLKPGMRFRLTVRWDRPLYGHEIKRALADAPIDKSTLETVQPIYTARPKFIGMPDPIRTRVVHAWLDRDEVSLVVPSEEPAMIHRPTMGGEYACFLGQGLEPERQRGGGLTLDMLYRDVLDAQPGHRRMTLFSRSARAVRLIQAGHATYDAVFDAMLSAALVAGVPGTRASLIAHINNGLRRGEAQP